MNPIDTIHITGLRGIPNFNTVLTKNGIKRIAR